MRTLPAAASLVLVASLGAQPTPAKTSFTGDVGVISASGNTQLRTLSVGDKIVHSNGRWVLSQLGAYIYGETNSASTANQLRFSGRSDYLFHPRVSAFANAAFERNTFAGFTRRTDESGGLSWKAIVAPWDSLSVDGGGVLTQQQNVDGTNRSFPAGRVAGQYKHAFSKASYFLQLAEYIPDLESTGEYRLNTESSIVAPVSSHAGIKVGYVVRYNSAPPVGFGTTDRVLTSGIQVTW